MRIIDADRLLKGTEDHQFIDTHVIWNAPTVDAIPVAYIESEKKRINVMVVEEAITGNIKEADRLSTIMAVMDALISNWRYTTGNDWRAENESD